MGSEDGGKIHARAGIVASRVPIPAHFRYCPQCLQEQLVKLGEPYWKRMHQLPGICVFRFVRPPVPVSSGQAFRCDPASMI